MMVEKDLNKGPVKAKTSIGEISMQTQVDLDPFPILSQQQRSSHHSRNPFIRVRKLNF